MGYALSSYQAVCKNIVANSSQDPATMPKFEKSFYKEDPAVAARTPVEIEAFRLEKQMRVQGRDVPKPVVTFDEAGFPSTY